MTQQLQSYGLASNLLKDSMDNTIEVPTGAYAVAQSPNSLSTVGIGSCMAICLYSPEHAAGALIHCMLPRAGQHVSNPYLYADTALSDVLEKLLHVGVEPATLTAKLVGGAQMFPALSANNQNIGQRNIEEVGRLLKVIGIPVAARDVGGSHGRSLVFDLDTGVVSVSKANGVPMQMI